MNVMNYSEMRAHLKKVMDHVVDAHEHVVVTRARGESVVMVSLSDWNAMEETLHLLTSPKNADRLRGAIAQLDNGNGVAHPLADINE